MFDLVDIFFNPCEVAVASGWCGCYYHSLSRFVEYRFSGLGFPIAPHHNIMFLAIPAIRRLMHMMMEDVLLAADLAEGWSQVVLSSWEKLPHVLNHIMISRNVFLYYVWCQSLSNMCCHFCIFPTHLLYFMITTLARTCIQLQTILLLLLIVQQEKMQLPLS